MVRATALRRVVDGKEKEKKKSWKLFMEMLLGGKKNAK